MTTTDTTTTTSSSSPRCLRVPMDLLHGRRRELVAAWLAPVGDPSQARERAQRRRDARGVVAPIAAIGRHAALGGPGGLRPRTPKRLRTEEVGEEDGRRFERRRSRHPHVRSRHHHVARDILTSSRRSRHPDVARDISTSLETSSHPHVARERRRSRHPHVVRDVIPRLRPPHNMEEDEEEEDEDEASTPHRLDPRARPRLPDAPMTHRGRERRN